MWIRLVALVESGNAQQADASKRACYLRPPIVHVSRIIW